MEVSYFFFFCVLIVLIICGDIVLNPGPKKDKSCDNFSLCHWKRNSIDAHDFSKLSLLEAYISHHMYQVICLSEKYLDSSVPFDDPRLNLSGYKLVRVDDLSNNKRSGVGIYFKETLAIWPVPTNNLKECLLREGFTGNKKGFLLLLYKSPSQPQEEFYDFLFSLDQLLPNRISQNPFFLLGTGDFNARNSSWWKNDCVPREGNKIESLSHALMGWVNLFLILPIFSKNLLHVLT